LAQGIHLLVERRERVRLGVDRRAQVARDAAEVMVGSAGMVLVA
jgi:hypothetical protein